MALFQYLNCTKDPEIKLSYFARSAEMNLSLLTFHFSPFTSHLSLLTFHFSPFTFHFSLFTFQTILVGAFVLYRPSATHVARLDRLSQNTYVYHSSLNLHNAGNPCFRCRLPKQCIRHNYGIYYSLFQKNYRFRPRRVLFPYLIQRI